MLSETKGSGFRVQGSGFSPAAGLKPEQSALQYPEIVTPTFLIK
jgi:hypothetical protein